MISVCMASYNGEKFIKQQIVSILSQLSDSDELIISDDGSCDNTVEIIKSFSDNRIKLLFHDKDQKLKKYQCSSFRFAASNFENALLHARGDFIFLSDQDDLWRFDKVKSMLDKLISFDFVMCNYSIIDENNDMLVSQEYQHNPMSKYYLKNLFGTPFLGCCMAFNRRLLNYSLPFPYACIGHDFWIGLLACKKSTYCFIDEPLHLYRKHSNNVSPVITKSENGIIFKIMYRIVLTFQYACRLLKKY
jgi:glycosyltransferase involved in cell wall biosynthesis